MKYCNNCGAVIQDDAMFCLNCGTAVTLNEAPVAAPQAAPVYAEPVNPVSEAPAVPAEAPKKKGKGKLVGLIIGGVLLLALIAFLIVGFATNWFGGPLGPIRAALEKTQNANSYTCEFEYEYKYEDSDKYSFTYEVEHVKDFATITYDNDSTNLSYDGKYYYISGDINDEYGNASIRDEDDLTSEYNFEQLLTDVILNKDIDDDNLEELIEVNKLDMDVDELKDFLKAIEKDCLSNQKWVEEFLGYKKDGSKYSFNVKFDDVIEDISERAYEADLISKSEKKEIQSEKSKAKMELEFEIKNGYIVSVEYSIKYSSYTVNYAIEYKKINETKIDEDDVDDIIDEVEAYIAKHYTACDVCGELVKNYNLYESGDQNLCYTCYEKDHECDKCGNITGSSYLCYEHYAYDYCDSCERRRDLYYYNVKTHEMLCSYCS